MDIIYTDIDAAKKAVRHYNNEVSRLQAELGVSESVDDSCLEIHVTAKYYKPDGSVGTYYA